MFHVERTLKSRIVKGIVGLFFLFSLTISCVGTKGRMTIPDYVVLRNGKEQLGTKPLNAFVFENKQHKVIFQRFLAAKLKLVNPDERDFWVTIDDVRYKILVYDNSELEKYFTLTDFIITDLQPENIETGVAPKFIGISMISYNNEDCLQENSIYYNVAVKYLKDLKDDYLKL